MTKHLVPEGPVGRALYAYADRYGIPPSVPWTHSSPRQGLADTLGLKPRIAYTTGDDVLDQLAAWQQAGHPLAHLDRGAPLRDLKAPVVTANAYLGGWGIAQALGRGADVVITGRVTDAALALGPAMWRFGWGRADWDRLAAGVVAGHLIECGAQCCGGNYSYFQEVPTYDRIGFPIVEMEPDGSFVITKHPGTGGLVSVGTVTAQLLYEIDASSRSTSC